MRKPTFRPKTKARLAVSLPDKPKREVRFSKSSVARMLKIHRRTIIRYVAAGLVTEDRKGRVRRSEVAEVLLSIPARRGGQWALRGKRLNFAPTKRGTKLLRDGAAHHAAGALGFHLDSVAGRKADEEAVDKEAALVRAVHNYTRQKEKASFEDLVLVHAEQLGSVPHGVRLCVEKFPDAHHDYLERQAVADRPISLWRWRIAPTGVPKPDDWQAASES